MFLDWMFIAGGVALILLAMLARHHAARTRLLQAVIGFAGVIGGLLGLLRQ